MKIMYTLCIVIYIYLNVFRKKTFQYIGRKFHLVLPQSNEEDLKNLQAQCESFKIAPRVSLVFTRGSKREAS